MRDLTRFIEDNERHKGPDGKRRRVPWEERAKMIEEEFPSVKELDWFTALEDEDLLARILKDVLKIDQIDPSRTRGARPALDVDKGMQTWNEIMGRQFCELPFSQAFTLLTRNDSVRTVAEKTHMAKSLVHRLLKGEERPSVDQMRAVAEAYGKKPSFFLEYRAEYCLAAVMSRFAKEPEMVDVVFTKLMRLA